MLAKLTQKAFTREGWIFENKLDGYRAIASINDGDVDLYSRNGNSFNKDYPPIIQSLKKIKQQVILDGEIVAENEKGEALFQLLQHYKTEQKGKLVYYVFDILFLNGHDTTQMPLRDRKELLQEFFKLIKTANIKSTEYVETEGEKFFDQIKKQKREGMIAKDLLSTYISDRRTDSWLKIKTVERQEAIIAGFTAPKGGRKLFGSLILAVNEDKKLRYIGNCGTGFDDLSLKEVYGKMKPLITKAKPFKEKTNRTGPITWLNPELICEVKFSEWTKDGHMRHPVFMGLRADKPAKAVTKEKPVSNPEKKPLKKNKSTQKKNLAEEKDKTIKLNGNSLKLTHLNKLFWPEEKITKGNLINYYLEVADYMMPFLNDRPVSLNRFPNGYRGKSFFQKNIEKDKSPSWLKTEPVFSASNNKNIEYLICENEATLIYMANLGCIEINPWLSRLPHLDKPDFMVIDLDPEKIDFNAVVETALATKEVLDETGLTGFCKTSGATGLHIYMPFPQEYDYDQIKMLAELLAQKVHAKVPKITSLERSPAKRQKKVYVDFLQNRKGQTIAAPYSVRPKPGATVATPLLWDELNEQLLPRNFTIHNIRERLKEKGEVWENILKVKNNLEEVIKKLENG